MSFKSNNKKSDKKIPTLDLHGMTADEAYESIEAFIYKQSKSSAPMIKIISGHGKGIVKQKLIEYLSQAGYSWHFEKLANGKNNDAVFLIPMN